MENIIENLKKNDDKSNKEILNLAVIKLKKYEIYDLLSMICDLIYEEKYTSNRIESLLEPFDEDEDLNNVVIMICREFLTSKEKIKYIVENSQNLGDIMYMLNILFDEKKNSNYQIIAENLLYCYSYELTNSDIENLLANLEEYQYDIRDDNTENISNYLKSKKKFIEEDYTKPYWVSLDEGENISLLATTPLGNSEDGETNIKFNKIIDSYSSFFYQLLPKKERYGEDASVFSISDLPENIKRSIQVFLTASTDSESSESGVTIGSPNRVWGPKNSILGKDCASGPEGKGPCRMLQCECLDLGEDDNNEVYEEGGRITWFTGKCDGCGDYIKDMSHALRFPHKDGGWTGCYCCFDCMISTPPVLINKEENILLGIMKTTIDKYGIMDRSSFC